MGKFGLNSKKVSKAIGFLKNSKLDFNLDFPINETTTMNQNFLMLAKQGGGKTNLYMIIINMLYEAYKESQGEFGAIPVVFCPLFEFTQLGLPSKRVNLPPHTNPQGIDALQFTFKMANAPEDLDVRTIGIRFRDLTQEDICAFAGFSGDLKILGNVQKQLEVLRNEKPKYTIDDFLEKCWEEKPLKDALYYVFSKLKAEGFFDENLEPIDWMGWLRERKPIIFNFGEIDDKNTYNSVTGILLRGLWEVSNKFYSAFLKKQRLNYKKENNQEISEREKLTEEEEFLLKNFTIALLFDEAHQIFYATKATGDLKYYPAHDMYKKISDLMGRKRGFKYNFLVTQKCMELYHGFRKSFTWLYVGSVIYQNDKDYMNTQLGVDKKHIGSIVNVGKFQWAVLNLDAYHSRRAGCVSHFQAYLSPCGQPV